jgi:signal transduction histidine kinase
MDALSAISLLVNGLTVALAFSFFLIVIWNDARKELNQLFAAFLFLIIMWNAGALLVQAITLIDPRSPLVRPAAGLMELGFIGSSVALYSVVAVLVKAGTRRFRALALLGLFIVLALRLLLILNDAPLWFDLPSSGAFVYRAQPVQTVFFMLFDGLALYLVWRYRRKIPTRGMVIGIVLFVVGQGLAFVNPALQTFSLAVMLCALATLLMSFALLRQEIFRPLAQRNSQVETIRAVSGAIAGQMARDQVLEQVTAQTATLLSADAVSIWLKDEGGESVSIATAHDLPLDGIRTRVALGEGIAGTVVRSQQSLRLDNYAREWRGGGDTPLERETYGSVIATPLIFAHEAIGALIVIAGRQGRAFERDDVYTLELLGAQAAVAISNSRAFDQLKELDRLKTEMVRMTTHDLKNPLQGAMANVELLREDLEALSNPEMMHSLDVIERQLIRMTRIISGVLNMERLKSEAQHIEPVPPARVLYAAGAEMRDFAVDARVDLRMDVDESLPMLPCDAEQLTRALINLLENAIKFTPQGGRVDVCAREMNGAICFSVQDTGVGIPDDVQPRVFDRFYRGKQQGMEHVSGSGLGLSLVKAVVENHRGSVWLESHVGQGTTFYMMIPLTAAPLTR